MDTSKLKQSLHDTTEAAMATAHSAVEFARDTGETLASDAGARAARVAGAVKDAVADRADSARSDRTERRVVTAAQISASGKKTARSVST